MLVMSFEEIEPRDAGDVFRINKWKFTLSLNDITSIDSVRKKMMYIEQISNRPIVGLVSTDRSMVAALLNTTPRPVTKSSANDSTPRP